MCQHIAESLETGVSVGFLTDTDSSESRPDASCIRCNEARNAAGGDWTDDVLKLVQVKLLCGACYDQARTIALSDPESLQ